jgi:predicted metal-dependent peptidase
MRIQDVMVHLLLKQPFYGYIAASVKTVESTEVPKIRLLSAPALTILYNRDWYEALKEEHAVGTVIHELLHLIFLHAYRKGNREHQRWEVACDMAVNEHIDFLLLTDDAITVTNIAREIKESIPRFKSAEVYYDILSKSEDQMCLSENEHEIKVCLHNGLTFKANKSMESDNAQMNKSALQRTIFEIMQEAVVEGEIPQGISTFINEIYKANEVNWRNILKRFLSGKGKTITRKTCKRESKRFENLPGNRRSTGSSELLAIDESGSILDVQVKRFYAEIMAIQKITGVKIFVTQFDTECTEPVPIERKVREKKRVKNGGTDFRPVFQLGDDLKIPQLILFTDGEGLVPARANQKVLWVLTKGGKNPAGFGDVIMLDI